MPEYQVIADPSIDGVSVGDILQKQEGLPYQDLNNPDVYISTDIVENTPEFFQVIS